MAPEQLTPGAGTAGFTLLELLIAVAVVGVLASIAIPSYLDHLTTARRADAQAALMAFAAALERHYTETGSYLGAGTVASAAGAANSAGAPASAIFPSEVPLEGSTKSYDLEIVDSITSNQFTLRASPKGAQSGDGILELDASGARRWDRDQSGGFSASEACWPPQC